MALGPDLPPLYCDDDALAQAIAAAGNRVGDPVWRMPFWSAYEANLDSAVADMNNVCESPFAGSVTAALFLRRFVKQAARYVHFDIYGWRPAPSRWVPRAASRRPRAPCSRCCAAARRALRERERMIVTTTASRSAAGTPTADDLAAEALRGRSRPRATRQARRARWSCGRAVARRAGPARELDHRGAVRRARHGLRGERRLGLGATRRATATSAICARIGAVRPRCRPATHRVRALGTFLYPAADIKSPPCLALSMKRCCAWRRRGRPSPGCRTAASCPSRHIAERGRFAPDFVAVAEAFLGVPYLWGGKTRLGVDCSGLLQVAMQIAGLDCPRDSDMQQAELGRDVPIGVDLDGLTRGDLVFWAGHVGIMLDAFLLLHANAHHMAVAVEPLKAAADRIARAGGRLTAIKRLELKAV